MDSDDYLKKEQFQRIHDTLSGILGDKLTNGWRQLTQKELETVGKNLENFWFRKAFETVPHLLNDIKVATDRELKVRLEGQPFPGPPRPFPWVTGQAVGALESLDVLGPHGYRGRRRIGKGVPDRFYALAGTPYADIESIIQRKRRVTADVNALLMGEAPATYHAEDLFFEAFESQLGFKIHGRNMSEFRGKKADRIEGKKPPDLDSIVERDGVIYGVDVKNWIKYEHQTREEVYSKIAIANQLDVVPFIIARYLDRELTNEIIYSRHGLVYEYKELIFPPTMRSLAEDATNLLGYPALATDSLPDDKTSRIEDIHKRFIMSKS